MEAEAPRTWIWETLNTPFPTIFVEGLATSESLLKIALDQLYLELSTLIKSTSYDAKAMVSILKNILRHLGQVQEMDNRHVQDYSES